MAQYFTDFSDATVGTVPGGWTPRWNSVSITWAIIEDATAAGGKALRGIDPNNSSIKGLSLDAVDSDPGRADAEVVVRWKPIAALSSLYAAACVRGSGDTHATANLYFAQSATGSQRRVGKRIAGSISTIQSAAFTHVLNTWYWMRVRVNGTTLSVKHWTDGDAEPEAWTFTSTQTQLTDGWAGVLVGGQNSTSTQSVFDLVGIGTGGDAAPTSAPSSTAVSFSGPVSNQAGAEGTAFSFSLASYFSGTETPFVYSLQSGTLPAGLSLSSSTGAITGTPTTAGTSSGIVVRATDQDSATADTNSFSITIDAALSPPSIAPGSTVATAVSSSQIDVSFAAVSGADGYDIERGGEATPLDIGNTLTYSHTGLSASTAYSYRVRAYNAAGDGPWSTAFGDTTEAAGTAITLVTDVDGGNASQTLSSITDATSETPVVYIDFRPTAISGTNGSGWRQALFAVESAAGKRPIFRLNRANMSTPTTAPTEAWRPYWTQDFQTWTRAPSRTLVDGSTGYIEFQFTDPLPAGRVYVASHPMGRQQEADAFAAWLLDTHAGTATPTTSANAVGVFSTSPAELDDTGRAIGDNPMYAIRLSWGGGTRKRLIQFAGIHAQGESSCWLSFVACVKWMLEDASPEAVDFRSRWDVYLYFNLTPNGIQGGHRRHNFRSSADPNRNFSISGTPTLVEIAAVQSAVIADVGETCDAFLSWHNYSSATNRFIPGRSHIPTAATMAFIDIGASIFGVTGMDYPESTTGIDRWWAEGRLAAKASFDAEVPQRGDTSVEEMGSIGRAWARTLQATDAAGWFDVAPTGTLTLGTPSVTSSSISLPWTYSAADHDGIEYRYRLTAGTWSAWIDAGLVSPIEITGLTSGAEYEIEARAYNSAGAGTPQTVTITVGAVTHEVVPVATTAQPTAGALSVSQAHGASPTGASAQPTAATVSVYSGVPSALVAPVAAEAQPTASTVAVSQASGVSPQPALAAPVAEAITVGQAHNVDAAPATAQPTASVVWLPLQDGFVPRVALGARLSVSVLAARIQTTARSGRLQ